MKVEFQRHLENNGLSKTHLFESYFFKIVKNTVLTYQWYFKMKHRTMFAYKNPKPYVVLRV